MPTFISKGRHFLLITKPQYAVRGAHGETSWEGGEEIEFVNGVYSTTKQEEIDILRNAVTYNVEFWEKGREPDRLLPTEEEMLGKITDAAVDRDIERLRTLRAEEETSHKRENVLISAERALGRLGDADGRRGPGRPKTLKD